MKPKSTRVRVLGGVLLAALAGSGALQADNNNPSIEACAGYAEADAVYDAALQQAREARSAAMQPVVVALDAALQQAKDARTAAINDGDEALSVVAPRAYDAYKAAERQAYDAYEAAKQPLQAAYEAAEQQAVDVLVVAYYASYDRDGGPRSDIHAVMVKLLEHHRQRCSELHGL